MKRTVSPDPLRAALQIVVGGLCTLNHHERSFAISDLNERIGHQQLSADAPGLLELGL
jgi:hypothetical protein